MNLKLINTKLVTRYLSLVAIASLLQSCANISAPTGGPKDETPPVMLRSEPENFATNFNGDQLEFKFDEYLQLKDINKQFVMSPPMRMPNITINGRELDVKFRDTLKPNTTYTLNFGNAVADLNEGNPYENFLFVFSTGASIDSFEMTGKLIDAFTHEPLPKINVMLYRTQDDSVVFKEKPYYFSQTDEKGIFHFVHIQEDCYKIVALNDKNNNLLFDVNDDPIAFLSQCVKSEKMKVAIKDTVSAKDSSLRAKDSLNLKPETRNQKPETIDSLNSKPQEKLTTLLLFKTASSQMATGEIDKAGVINLSFRVPVDDISLTLVDTANENVAFKSKWNKTSDKLQIWPQRDSKQYRIFISIGDYKDTLKILVTAVPTRSKMMLSVNNSGGVIPIYEKIKLTSNVPINYHIPNQMTLIRNNNEEMTSDTIAVSGSFTDKTQMEFVLNEELKELFSYQLIVPDSCFVDIYGFKNDTVISKFSTDLVDNYSSVKFEIRNSKPGTSLIMQCCDEKGTIFGEQKLASETSATFKNLKPGIYVFRIIFDENKNGRWDAGNYIEHRQPEKVLYFGRKITTEAGWGYEEAWTLKDDE